MKLELVAECQAKNCSCARKTFIFWHREGQDSVEKTLKIFVHNRELWHQKSQNSYEMNDAQLQKIIHYKEISEEVGICRTPEIFQNG